MALVTINDLRGKMRLLSPSFGLANLRFGVAACVLALTCAFAQTKPDARAVTNSADYSDSVAPGGLATVFGESLSASASPLTAAGVPLPRSLGDVQVTVNQVAAPLLYVSPTQINIQVPYETSPGTATVVVSTNGIHADPLNLEVLSSAPAVFQDSGANAVAQNQDYTNNSSSAPAPGGSVLILYFTDLGLVAPPVPSGDAAPLGQLFKGVASPKATLAGTDVRVQFAGLTPEYVGLSQANIQLPEDLVPGEYPITLTTGGYTSLAALVFLNGAATQHTAYVQPNSAKPLQQWTGDLTQLYVGDRTVALPTNGLSQTRYGVWGQGAGTSALFPDGRIFFFFGDTVTAYRGSDGKWYDYQRNSCGENKKGTCIGVDTIGFIPSATGLDKCNALANAVSTLSAGKQLAAIDYGNCPVIQYLTDPSRAANPNLPKAAWTQDSSVTGLVGDEGVLGGRIPTGVFVNGTSLYSIYEAVTRKPNTSGTKYDLESMLLKANQPVSAIGANTPITWRRLYPWSIATVPTGSVSITRGSATVSASPGTFQSEWAGHSVVWEGIEINNVRYGIVSTNSNGSALTLDRTVASATDPSAVFNVLPAKDTQPGKFMSVAPVLLDLNTMNALGIENALPAPLKGLSSVLFVIGSGYQWRSSNVYLLAMDLAKVDASSNSGKGIADAWYLTSLSPSSSSWVQGNESQAAPLLGNWQHRGPHGGGQPCVGEVSVRWAPLLNRFLMTYGQASCGGIYVRTATTPWGPWSYEQSVWSNTPNQGWEGMIVHDPRSHTPDFNAQPVLYDGTQPCCVPMSEIAISPWGLPGNPFAPFLLPVQTDNGDGTVRAYMNLSMFDPYVVFLVGFDVRKP